MRVVSSARLSSEYLCKHQLFNFLNISWHYQSIIILIQQLQFGSITSKKSRTKSKKILCKNRGPKGLSFRTFSSTLCIVKFHWGTYDCKMGAFDCEMSGFDWGAFVCTRILCVESKIHHFLHKSLIIKKISVIFI